MNPENDINLQCRVSSRIMKDFDNLAEAAGLRRSSYLKMWIAMIIRLKREHAIRALTALPDTFFKASPGRPRENVDEEPPK